VKAAFPADQKGGRAANQSIALRRKFGEQPAPEHIEPMIALRAAQRGLATKTNDVQNFAADRNFLTHPTPSRRMLKIERCGAGGNQTASEVRAVDFSRTGLPPGGFLGKGSRLDSASRISSMETVRLAPGMARNDGHDVTAAASDAQDARMAFFSARDSAVSASTSRG
jgi:hypothetical protein